MLTLILLVVLGGGVGLLAVSFAESPKTATWRRSHPRGRTLRAPAAEPAEPAPRKAPAPREDDEALESTHPPGDASHERLRRTDRRGSVPAQRTAIEGAYADVARASLPRRVVSLVGIATITVIAGLSVALVIGAVAAGAAAILDRAI